MISAPPPAKVIAELDQTRAVVRDILRDMSAQDTDALIRIASAGQLEALDERAQLLVGLLAVVQIFEIHDSLRVQHADEGGQS